MASSSNARPANVYDRHPAVLLGGRPKAKSCFVESDIRSNARYLPTALELLESAAFLQLATHCRVDNIRSSECLTGTIKGQPARLTHRIHVRC